MRAGLEGRWRLTRRVEDRVLRADMGFGGEARFTPVEGGLSYRETGQWTGAPWGPLSGERSYLWRFREGFVDVCYPDGSAFHQFKPGLKAEAEHLCGRDLYAGLYRFDLPSSWSLTWHVRGPHKDYSSATLFAREV